MFLLVISVNHTNTRFKVSLWILLTGKSAGFFIPNTTDVTSDETCNRAYETMMMKMEEFC
jgi:hypothetical protein